MNNEKMDSSRRAVVIGGAATAAVVGPIAAGMVTGSSPIPVWTPPAPQAALSEIKDWETLLGKSIKISGENGSCFAYLQAVRYAPADPTRPAALARSIPFTLIFNAHVPTAPVGNKTYRVLHRLQGNIEMFFSRTPDKRGFAWLTAEYN